MVKPPGPVSNHSDPVKSSVLRHMAQLQTNWEWERTLPYLIQLREMEKGMLSQNSVTGERLTVAAFV